MATAIDNKNLKNFCGGCDCPGFSAAVSVAFDPVAKTAVVQDNSIYGAGDGLAAVNVTVSDRHGNHKYENISTTGVAGKKTVSLTGMNLTEGINVLATVVSNNRCVADMGAYNVGLVTGSATVNLGYVDNEGDTDGGYVAP